MPNHVTSICTVTGPDADVGRFHDAHLSREGRFDFESIIPSPACLKDIPSDSSTELAMLAYLGERTNASVNFDGYGFIRDIVNGPRFRHARQVLAWLEKSQPEALVNARRCFAAIAECGFGNWYTWNTHHWGTKWNSYDFDSRERSDGRYVFKFETAWSFPEPIFRKLTEMYPTLEFAIVAYDEGSNFACTGSFGGANDYATVDATDELYERVYGHPREQDDEEATT